MAKPLPERSAWSGAVRLASALAKRTLPDWADTYQQPLNAPTQFIPNPEDYLAEADSDFARHLGPGQWEWFVTGTPAEVLQRELQQHQAAPMIALHDVGTTYGRHLLGELAAAAHTTVQRLVLRHRDDGVVLATLWFVELAGGADGSPLRLYSTEVDADMQQRSRIARVLLAHSRLGVVLVGDLPGHALQSALRPLHDAIIAGPWHNRQLLMLPLATAGALAGQVSQFALGTGVSVHCTPQVGRSADAWAFISGAWNRLRTQLRAATPTLPSSLAVVSTAPAPAAAAAAAASPASAAWSAALVDYMQQCATLRGLLAACVFDTYTQRVLGHTGERFDPTQLAGQGAALFGAMVRTRGALDLGDAPPELSLTLGEHLLLLRPLPRHPGRSLLAVLDRQVANPMLVRLQLQRLDVLLADL